VYLSDKYEQTDSARASKLMLEKAGIAYRKVVTSVDQIVLSFDEKDV
jgi:dCMP deaminase